MTRCCTLQAFFALLLYLPIHFATALAQAQEGSPTAGSQVQTIYQLIPPIANNEDHAVTGWRRYVGGQNFTWCCTKAVADSLTVDANNTLALADNAPTVNLNLTTLQIATDNGQFPCGASYSGQYPSGAPEIVTSYIWMSSTCPGWQLSGQDNLNAWLQPLSSFLLPAVVFCLSVPRRRKFHVPRSFFVSEIGGFKSNIPYVPITCIFEGSSYKS